jgi:hypothetical protein
MVSGLRARIVAARLMDALKTLNIKYQLFEDTEAMLIVIPFDQFREVFDRSNLEKEGVDFSTFLDAQLALIIALAGLRKELHSCLLKGDDGWTFEIPRWGVEEDAGSDCA